MSDTGNKKWRKGNDTLALALAAGQTMRDAAALIGVCERTVARRLADPEFCQRVTELRNEMVTRAVGRLADGMVAAADTLRSLLQAEGEYIRLGAAKAILELGHKLCETMELEQRLEALEQAVREANLCGSKTVSDNWNRFWPNN
jgi:hypothetical protein